MTSNITFPTTLTPFEIYTVTNSGIDSIFLDSSKEDSPYTNYSIIGIHPFHTIKVEEENLYTKSYPKKEYLKVSKEPFSYLRSFLAKNKEENTTNLPILSGGIGYFSYDVVRLLESLPNTNPPLYTIPDIYLVFYDILLLYCHKTKELTIAASGKIHAPKSEIENIKHKIIAYEKQKNSTPAHKIKKLSTSPFFYKKTEFFSQKAYMDAIKDMIQYIENGDIYIANMTHTLELTLPKKENTYHSKESITSEHQTVDHDSLALYKCLRTTNPAPFSAYMPLDGFEILSSSPERFLHIKDKKVETRPIKGTRPRVDNLIQNQKNIQELLHSEKDKSELLMIVDLERNDLSKVCKPHSVKVTELFALESYATVHHLVSTVTGELREDTTAIDCLKHAFPGGSITGAPKIRAMEIIEELEYNKRGIYTGSIGYLGFDGSMDMNIVIRTLVKKDNTCYLGIGGGITYESDEAMEYQETLDKAKAILDALQLYGSI